MVNDQMEADVLTQVNDFWLVWNVGNQDRYKKLGLNLNDHKQLETLFQAISRVMHAMHQGTQLDDSNRESDDERGFKECRLTYLPHILAELVGIARICEDVCSGRYIAILSDVKSEIFPPLVGDNEGMDWELHPVFDDAPEWPEEAPPPYSKYDTRSSFMSFALESCQTGQRYLQDVLNSLWALTLGTSVNTPQPDPPAQEAKYRIEDTERSSSLYSAVFSTLSTLLSNLPWATCDG